MELIPLPRRSVPADLPRHVAVIMDGNGRWAARRGLPRVAGHHAGARAVREVVRAARQLGLRYLTLYAFSSENWQRPPAEVQRLMELLAAYLVEEQGELRANRIELAAIGDLERLPARARRLLNEVGAATRGGDGMRLTLALAYGGRDEIVRAARALAAEVAAGRLWSEQIDERLLGRRLDTAAMPDPDLVIRTGGESRLSNFLLWQAAYAELYVTEVAWPDFDRSELERALAWYAGRDRRFGALPAAIG
jgi:undecaprenyl diphosphate synthase